MEKSFPGWKNWPQDDEDVLNLVGLHVTNYSSVEHTPTDFRRGAQQKGPLLLHFSGFFFSVTTAFPTGFARLLTHGGSHGVPKHTHSLTALFPPCVCARDLFIIFFFSLRANRSKNLRGFSLHIGRISLSLLKPDRLRCIRAEDWRERFGRSAAEARRARENERTNGESE